jgi:metal iron transporter
MRYFELLITGLILVVVSSFIALLVRVKPNWGDVFFGYIPGPGIVANGGVYLAVG